MPFNSLNLQSGVSEINSTTTTLAADETYTGIIENVQYYSSVLVVINSDKPSASGGINVQFSQDGTNWDINDIDTYINPNQSYSKHFCIKSKYFRIRYTNGSAEQTHFRLQCIMHVNIQFSPSNQTVSFNQQSHDAFHRIRTSNPQTLFDMNHVLGKNTFLMDESITGVATSTYNSNSSTMILTVSDNGDKITRQSRRYISYQPGKSLVCICSGVLNLGDSNQSDVESRIGYFDDNNGIFFYYDGTTLGICKRSYSSGSIVETRVPQSEWNIDSMDGTGSSGITLNSNKTQIFMIDIQWLGVGTVRCAISMDNDIYYVHKFYHANNLETTYMSTGTLPPRFEIEATGPNSTGSMLEICSTVISEGGYEPLGPRFTVGNNVGIDIDTTDERPLLAIRLKDAFKRGTAQLLSINIVNTTKGDTRYRIRIYRDVETLTNLFTTNLTFTSVNTNSIVEYNLAPSFSGSNVNIQPNRIIQEDFATDTSRTALAGIERGTFIASNIAGTRDIAVLTAQSLVSNNQNILGNISWSEFP